MVSLTAFVRLARPKFLLGGGVSFALGVAVAAAADLGPVTAGVYLAGQAMVTAFHLMTHFANDYFDRRSDRFGEPSAFAGGSGVLVRGDLAPRTALVTALVCAACGTLLAARFMLTGNPVAAGFGAAIGLLAWIYSAPPLRLAARGWGEVDTAAVVAVLVPLTGYAVVSQGGLGAQALAATAAPLFAMLAMMIAVEWPDRQADRHAGKRNLVVRLGDTGAARVASGCAALTVPAFAATIAAGGPVTLAAFALLLTPVAVGLVRALRSPRAPADEIAARGVTLFLLTVVFATLGYVSSLH